MELDCRGLKCPLPVLKTEKALEGLGPDEVLVVLANDPVARVDIALHCRQNGFACTLETSEEGTLHFTISHPMKD